MSGGEDPDFFLALALEVLSGLEKQKVCLFLFSLIIRAPKRDILRVMSRAGLELRYIFSALKLANGGI
jgi:hypothetical protein